ERYRSKVDRRVVHTRLTPAGETALDEAPPLLPGFEQAFRALPQADQATLAQALETAATLMADGRRRAHDEAGEMVDATGIEPVAPSVGTRCSPAELRIRRFGRRDIARSGRRRKPSGEQAQSGLTAGA